MKKLFIIILSIFNLAQINGQSSWRADLRVYNESYIQQTEVNVNMVADLYYDDVLVSPQPNYKYEFFYKYVSTEWIRYITSPQWGINIQGTHTYQDSTIIPQGKFDIYFPGCHEPFRDRG